MLLCPFLGLKKIPLGDRVGWNPLALTLGSTALTSYYRVSLFCSFMYVHAFSYSLKMIEDVFIIVLVLHTKILKKYISNTSH